MVWEADVVEVVAVVCCLLVGETLSGLVASREMVQAALVRHVYQGVGAGALRKRRHNTLKDSELWSGGLREGEQRGAVAGRRTQQRLVDGRPPRSGRQGLPR